MLPYYAERLSTVEINYTFYRMPTERLLLGWSEVTPAAFKFTLKAPRRVTHEGMSQELLKFEAAALHWSCYTTGDETEVQASQ